MQGRNGEEGGGSGSRYVVSPWYPLPAPLSDIPGPYNGPSGVACPGRPRPGIICDLFQGCSLSRSRPLVRTVAFSACTYPSSTAYAVGGSANPCISAPPLRATPHWPPHAVCLTAPPGWHWDLRPPGARSRKVNPWWPQQRPLWIYDIIEAVATEMENMVYLGGWALKAMGG